ncbi:MAG: S-methyl-5-thioribose-1-phosphate isomerase [candidate division WOR-3 bacterium]
MKNIPDPLIFKNNSLLILDQRKLPQKETYFEARSYSDVKKAIKEMILRGAPLIGIAGAYGILLGLKRNFKIDSFYKMKDELLSLRKTAYNLNFILSYLEELIKKGAEYKELLREVERIFEKEKERCEKIGENGYKIFKGNKYKRVLTHCNTGKLATGGIGTALGVIYKSRKNIEHVYVTETRPYFQGARLTSYELHKSKIPFTIIIDSMASFLMLKGEIDAVIVGADRITEDGYVANKIGTLSLAISAKEYGVPFYVAAPVSTIDFKLKGMQNIPIETRSGEEVRGWGKTKWVPKDYKILYYSFDLTPPNLIKFIITDVGNFKPEEIKMVQIQQKREELLNAK